MRRNAVFGFMRSAGQGMVLGGVVLLAEHAHDHATESVVSIVWLAVASLLWIIGSAGEDS